MILKKLKEDTREQHEGLEEAVDILNGDFSLDDYERVLIKFYRFYRAMEPALPAVELAENGFDIEGRRKLQSLENDLKQLGIFEKASLVPAWDKAPKPDSAAKACGSVYVLEGATLGGQVIGRSLRDRLGITPENGGSFFYSYGPEVGPKWKEFGAVITEFAEKNGDDESIIQAAKDTFDGFKDCFSEDI